MFRTISLSLPSNQTDSLVAKFQEVEGVIGIKLIRGISLKPKGDALILDVNSNGLQKVFKILDDLGVADSSDISISTSEPLSYISQETRGALFKEEQNSTAEELEETLTKESAMNPNLVYIMAASGVLATVGILEDSLHLVIAAMVIAPGFEPLSAVAAGSILKGNLLFRRALMGTLKGYTALILSASLTSAFILYASDHNGSTPYLPKGVLMSYWTSITPSSTFIAILAGVAGGILIATHRSVLTAGVMIALALIPSAAIVGISLTSGDVLNGAISLLRLIVELLIVYLSNCAVFMLKKHILYKRFSLRRNRPLVQR